MTISGADLNGFIRDLLETIDAIDAEKLRLVLARNRLDIVSVDDPPADGSEADRIGRVACDAMWHELQGCVEKARIGSGPLRDVIVVEHIGDHIDLEDHLTIGKA